MARVLVVDDDRDILELVRLRLERAGHVVLAAAGGPEALEAVEEHGPPHVAVLDVAMPEMDGHALLRALRALPGQAALPAAFLSARVQPQDIAAGRALGAAYVAKPFRAADLLAVVEDLAGPTG
jgi:CheY-like chemotaxis protein